MNVLVVLGCGAAGAFIGFWAGVFACREPGDIGIGVITWGIGGAAIGAAIGVGAGVAVFT